ncbi:hypothetical protein [Bacillus sp. 166amftsu]|uniref:hypothetical protein n=1 Tax=Bacillus sp. 166amftsu TaxID=1761753 RepID=UPI00089A1972|nr:hypothetical protein [Bacillus sp. 166amftsu]SDZ37968.1 hypothetical protein SAMN04488156_12254 [Bacillus sp. 166amftsu]
MFIPIHLDSYCNNIGVTSNDTIYEGNLTLNGSSLPLEGPFCKQVFYFEHIPFYMKKLSKFDNIAMEGQEIKVNAYNAKNIHIIGNSVSGSYFDDISFKSEGEIIERKRLSLTDFISEEPVFNNQLFYRFTKINSRQPLHLKGSLWKQSINFEPSINVESIILEDNPFIHIFAITIEEGLKTH